MKKSVLVLVFFFSTVLFTPLFGQLVFKTAFESGLFQVQNADADLINRLSAQLLYRHRFDRFYINLSGKLNPEFLGTAGRSNTFKLKSDFTVGQQKKRYSWQGRLMNRRYFYHLQSNGNLSFEVTMLHFNLFFFKRKGSSTQLQFFYINRQLNRSPQSALNAAQFRAGKWLSFNRYKRFNISIGLERFGIQSESVFNQRESNEGWRLSPEIAVSFQKRSVLRFSLRFVLQADHRSNRQNREWLVQLIYGKLFARRWSFFVYINYRRVEKPSAEVPLELTYSAIDNENWLYAKLGFDLNRQNEFFLKAGYLKDTFPGRGQYFSNRQLLLGWQWKMVKKSSQ